jgi:catechol 2,3-dioxygenase-like lactoylglutathione lyase family enzyme
MGEPVISFKDPDGLNLELVGVDDSAPRSEAITGFHGVALRVEAPDRTVKVLTEVLGYRQTQDEAGLQRFSTSSAARGRHIDVLCSPGAMNARLGGGTVHHIAFRAKDEQELGGWREMIAGLGFNVTPILDRNYFRSIYFREPGGILFEVATDPPGFAVDEAPDELGTSLKLPQQYESRRADIERRLPPVRLPTAGAS